MHFSSLNTLEETIYKTGNNGEYTYTKFSIPVKDEHLTLKGLFAKPKNRSKYYHAVEHPKQRIVLHFTAGQLRSDLQALTRNDFHVSVPFVIARSGVIYQLFSSKYWSGHIGKGIGNINTGNAQDKVTIGIELSNYGYLTERDGNLETYYSRQKDAAGRIGPVDVYCSITQKDAYKKIDSPFREQLFYASFTEAQYESLIILLRYLTKQYNIPRQFLPEPKRYQATEDILNFRGIVSHVNYRPSGKWDIGPGFEWDKVIKGVQAQVYTPTASIFESMESERDVLESTEESIHSEEQLEGLLPEAKDPVYEDEPYEEVY